jgi:hypothetical protein
MGTAVLSGKADVLEVEGVGKEVWAEEEDYSDKENFFEDLAHSLRLEGYDAVSVYEGYDESEILKYFNPETGRVWTEEEYEKIYKQTAK